MTGRREGLALLAGEVVVVALALLLVAASRNLDPVAFAGRALPPVILGAGLVVVGAALGALRTAENVDGRAAVGELGLGVAAALGLAAGARPLGLAVAAAIAAASVRLRVDDEQVFAVFDR